MIDMPTLVAQATTAVKTKEEKPIFVEQLCIICNAAMELGDNQLPTCSQCGMTDKQAKALDNRRPRQPEPARAPSGWYLEDPTDREPVNYIDIPKTANNHRAVKESNDIKPDLGMPKKKPKDIGAMLREVEAAKAGTVLEVMAEIEGDKLEEPAQPPEPQPTVPVTVPVKKNRKG